MIAVALLLAASVLAFAWVATRARREWSEGEELSRATAIGILALYPLYASPIAVALALRPWAFEMPLGVALAAGGALVVAGLALAGVGARLFGSSRQLFGVERGGLVEGDVYRFSRNPQYAGLALAVLGAGVVGRSGLALALAALLFAGFWTWVAGVEEPHLRGAFGSRYEDYKDRTPRFLGLPRPL